MPARVANLSPFPTDTLQSWFEGTHEVEVVAVPDPPAPEAVKEAVREAELVLGDNRHRHRVDRAVLEAMTRCRLIQMPAVGFDVIDHRTAGELGIPVANAAGYNRDAVADWVLMAMLNLIRFGAYGDRKMREGESWPRPGMTGRELGALTVGIVGLGNVGGAVAARLQGFGSRVIFADAVPRSFGGARQLSLDEVLAQSDIITIHTPLDHDTRALIDREAIAKMRRGTILINASRGPVVDESAVIEALDSGQLGGAGLDVFESEPLADDSALRRFENVFISPHVGGASEQAQARVLQVCAANMRRVLDGEPPFNVVNQVAVRAASTPTS